MSSPLPEALMAAVREIHAVFCTAMRTVLSMYAYWACVMMQLRGGPGRSLYYLSASSSSCSSQDFARMDTPDVQTDKHIDRQTHQQKDGVHRACGFWQKGDAAYDIQHLLTSTRHGSGLRADQPF